MSRYEYLPGALLRIFASAWVDKQSFTLNGERPSIFFRVPDADDTPPFVLISTFVDSPFDEFLREEQATFLCVVSEDDGVHGAVALRTLIADMVTKPSALTDLNRYIELSETALSISIPYRFKEMEIVGSSDEPDWDEQGKLINAAVTIRYTFTFNRESLAPLSDLDFSAYV